MKSKLFILLAALLSLSLLCGIALAETADPAAKFRNTWVADNFHILIYAADEGDDVNCVAEIEQLADPENRTGFIWEVHASYDAPSDTLKAYSVLKWDAYMEDGKMNEGEHLFYEDEGDATSTTFSVNEDGRLLWQDSHEDAGKGLEFEAIGGYEGVWPGEKEGEQATILWADDHYTVYVEVFNDRGEQESYAYNAFYEPDQGGILSASGTCDVITLENGQETGRTELVDDINATLSINSNYDLVWENTAPQGVKTRTFRNKYGASADTDG